MTNFRKIIENILQEDNEYEFNVGDFVKLKYKQGPIYKIDRKQVNKLGRVVYLLKRPLVKVEMVVNFNYEKERWPKIEWISQPVPEDQLLPATEKEFNEYVRQLKTKEGFNTPALEEDTVKQNGSWVNKGKEGTHGKFKTKKQADNQRKAMFANGYKG